MPQSICKKRPAGATCSHQLASSHGNSLDLVFFVQSSKFIFFQR